MTGMDESESHPRAADAPEALARPPAARRRRWLQFSVRSLLLVILLCAAGVYAGRVCFEAYRRQRQAMALIEKLGGRYETTEATGWLRRLFAGHSQDVILADLADCNDPSAYLDQIAALPALETLVVGGRSFSDEDLSPLRGVKSLQGLVLDSTSVTEEGLATFSAALPHAVVYRSQRRAIASLRKMADVNVKPSSSHARLQTLVGGVYFDEAQRVAYWLNEGDVDLVPLEHFDTLLTLDLSRTGVSGEPLVSVKSLKNLRRLDLTGTRVGDAGLAHVAHLSHLRTLRLLELSNTTVTDAGLRHLQGMTSLSSLSLSETQVGDAGLLHLHGMTSLDSLSLNDTQVGDVGLAQLEHCDLRYLEALANADQRRRASPSATDVEPLFPCAQRHASQRCRLGPFERPEEARPSWALRHANHRSWTSAACGNEQSAAVVCRENEGYRRRYRATPTSAAQLHRPSGRVAAKS